MRQIILVKEYPDGKRFCFDEVFTTTQAARTQAVEDFYYTNSEVSARHEHHHMDVLYWENQLELRFISDETGEIFAQYFLLYVSF